MSVTCYVYGRANDSRLRGPRLSRRKRARAYTTGATRTPPPTLSDCELVQAASEAYGLPSSAFRASHAATRRRVAVRVQSAPSAALAALYHIEEDPDDADIEAHLIPAMLYVDRLVGYSPDHSRTVSPLVADTFCASSMKFMAVVHGYASATCTALEYQHVVATMGETWSRSSTPCVPLIDTAGTTLTASESVTYALRVGLQYAPPRDHHVLRRTFSLLRRMHCARDAISNMTKIVGTWTDARRQCHFATDAGQCTSAVRFAIEAGMVDVAVLIARACPLYWPGHFLPVSNPLQMRAMRDAYGGYLVRHFPALVDAHIEQIFTSTDVRQLERLFDAGIVRDGDSVVLCRNSKTVVDVTRAIVVALAGFRCSNQRLILERLAARCVLSIDPTLDADAIRPFIAAPTTFGVHCAWEWLCRHDVGGRDILIPPQYRDSHTVDRVARFLGGKWLT